MVLMIVPYCSHIVIISILVTPFFISNTSFYIYYGTNSASFTVLKMVIIMVTIPFQGILMKLEQ